MSLIGKRKLNTYYSVHNILSDLWFHFLNVSLLYSLQSIAVQINELNAGRFIAFLSIFICPYVYLMGYKSVPFFVKLVKT